MSDTGIRYANDPATPPSGTAFEPATGFGGEDVAFSSDATASASTGRVEEAKQAVRENTSKLTGQAGDKAREYAEMGKTRAYDALGQLAGQIRDAATQIDDKLGAQYGDYARSAAGQVTGFADRIQAADVDEVVDDVRAFVRRSPGVAIGAAATVGFVLARLVQAGVDGRPD